MARRRKAKKKSPTKKQPQVENNSIPSPAVEFRIVQEPLIDLSKVKKEKVDDGYEVNSETQNCSSLLPMGWKSSTFRELSSSVRNLASSSARLPNLGERTIEPNPSFSLIPAHKIKKEKDDINNHYKNTNLISSCSEESRPSTADNIGISEVTLGSLVFESRVDINEDTIDYFDEEPVVNTTAAADLKDVALPVKIKTEPPDIQISCENLHNIVSKENTNLFPESLPTNYARSPQINSQDFSPENAFSNNKHKILKSLLSAETCMIAKNEFSKEIKESLETEYSTTIETPEGSIYQDCFKRNTDLINSSFTIDTPDLSSTSNIASVNNEVTTIDDNTNSGSCVTRNVLGNIQHNDEENSASLSTRDCSVSIMTKISIIDNCNNSTASKVINIKKEPVELEFDYNVNSSSYKKDNELYHHAIPNDSVAVGSSVLSISKNFDMDNSNNSLPCKADSQISSINAEKLKQLVSPTSSQNMINVNSNILTGNSNNKEMGKSSNLATMEMSYNKKEHNVMAVKIKEEPPDTHETNITSLLNSTSSDKTTNNKEILVNKNNEDNFQSIKIKKEPSDISQPCENSAGTPTSFKDSNINSTQNSCSKSKEIINTTQVMTTTIINSENSIQAIKVKEEPLDITETCGKSINCIAENTPTIETKQLLNCSTYAVANLADSQGNNDAEINIDKQRDSNSSKQTNFNSEQLCIDENASNKKNSLENAAHVVISEKQLCSSSSHSNNVCLDKNYPSDAWENKSALNHAIPKASNETINADYDVSEKNKVQDLNDTLVSTSSAELMTEEFAYRKPNEHLSVLSDSCATNMNTTVEPSSNIQDRLCGDVPYFCRAKASCTLDKSRSDQITSSMLTEPVEKFKDNSNIEGLKITQSLQTDKELTGDCSEMRVNEILDKCLVPQNNKHLVGHGKENVHEDGNTLPKCSKSNAYETCDEKNIYKNNFVIYDVPKHPSISKLNENAKVYTNIDFPDSTSAPIPLVNVAAQRLVHDKDWQIFSKEEQCSNKNNVETHSCEGPSEEETWEVTEEELLCYLELERDSQNLQTADKINSICTKVNYNFPIGLPKCDEKATERAHKSVGNNSISNVNTNVFDSTSKTDQIFKHNLLNSSHELPSMEAKADSTIKNNLSNSSHEIPNMEAKYIRIRNESMLTNFRSESPQWLSIPSVTKQASAPLPNLQYSFGQDSITGSKQLMSCDINFVNEATKVRSSHDTIGVDILKGHFTESNLLSKEMLMNIVHTASNLESNTNTQSSTININLPSPSRSINPSPVLVESNYSSLSNLTKNIDQQTHVPVHNLNNSCWESQNVKPSENQRPPFVDSSNYSFSNLRKTIEEQTPVSARNSNDFGFVCQKMKTSENSSPVSVGSNYSSVSNLTNTIDQQTPMSAFNLNNFCWEYQNLKTSENPSPVLVDPISNLTKTGEQQIPISARKSNDFSFECQKVKTSENLSPALVESNYSSFSNIRKIIDQQTPVSACNFNNSDFEYQNVKASENPSPVLVESNYSSFSNLSKAISQQIPVSTRNSNDFSFECQKVKTLEDPSPASVESNYSSFPNLRKTIDQQTPVSACNFNNSGFEYQNMKASENPNLVESNYSFSNLAKPIDQQTSVSADNLNNFCHESQNVKTSENLRHVEQSNLIPNILISNDELRNILKKSSTVLPESTMIESSKNLTIPNSVEKSTDCPLKSPDVMSKLSDSLCGTPTSACYNANNDSESSSTEDTSCNYMPSNNEDLPMENDSENNSNSNLSTELKKTLILKKNKKNKSDENPTNIPSKRLKLKTSTKYDKILERQQFESKTSPERLLRPRVQVISSDPKLAEFCERQRQKKKVTVPIINPLPIESNESLCKLPKKSRKMEPGNEEGSVAKQLKFKNKEDSSKNNNNNKLSPTLTKPGAAKIHPTENTRGDVSPNVRENKSVHSSSAETGSLKTLSLSGKASDKQLKTDKPIRKHSRWDEKSHIEEKDDIKASIVQYGNRFNYRGGFLAVNTSQPDKNNSQAKTSKKKKAERQKHDYLTLEDLHSAASVPEIDKISNEILNETEFQRNVSTMMQNINTTGSYGNITNLLEIQSKHSNSPQNPLPKRIISLDAYKGRNSNLPSNWIPQAHNNIGSTIAGKSNLNDPRINRGATLNPTSTSIQKTNWSVSNRPIPHFSNYDPRTVQPQFPYASNHNPSTGMQPLCPMPTPAFSYNLQSQTMPPPRYSSPLLGDNPQQQKMLHPSLPPRELQPPLPEFSPPLLPASTLSSEPMVLCSNPQSPIGTAFLHNSTRVSQFQLPSGNLPTTLPYAQSIATSKQPLFQTNMTDILPPQRQDIARRNNISHLTSTKSPRVEILKKLVGNKYILSEDALLLILTWNVNWISQQQYCTNPPPVANRVKYVSPKYKCFEDHFNTYVPLLFYETWERLSRAAKELKTNSTFYFHIKSFKPQGDMFQAELATNIKSSDMKKFLHPCEGYLLLVKFSETGMKIYGYVKKHEVLSSCDTKYDVDHIPNPASNEKKQTLLLFVNLAWNVDSVDRCGLARLQILNEIKPVLQQIDSLNSMVNSPLGNTVLLPTEDECKLVELERVGTYSSSAHITKYVSNIMEGIMFSVPLPRIVVVNARPGTDKIGLTVALIEKLKTENTDDQERILYCSRSKREIEEIGFRLMPSNIDDAVPMSIVILGKSIDIHPGMKKLSLKERVHQHKLKRIAKPDIKSSDSQEKDVSDHDESLTHVLETSNVFLSTIANCYDSDVYRILGKNSRTPFSCCIIDDCNLFTEPETLIPILYGVRKLVLIGDPDIAPKLQSKYAIKHDFNLSLMKRINEVLEIPHK